MFLFILTVLASYWVWKRQSSPTASSTVPAMESVVPFVETSRPPMPQPSLSPNSRVPTPRNQGQSQSSPPGDYGQPNMQQEPFAPPPPIPIEPQQFPQGDDSNPGYPNNFSPPPPPVYPGPDLEPPVEYYENENSPPPPQPFEPPAPLEEGGEFIPPGSPEGQD